VGDSVYIRVAGGDNEGPYKVETVDVANKKYTICDSQGVTAKDGKKLEEADLVAAEAS
jgi:hypothetical protein